MEKQYVSHRCHYYSHRCCRVRVGQKFEENMWPFIAECTDAGYLRKLEEFEATMIHGKDLFASTQNLLFYSFGSQGFLDIFRLACSNQKYLGRCTEISRKLCNAAISSLEPLLDTTRHPDKRDEIIEHMQVFWEVCQLKSIPNLLEGEVSLSIDRMLNQIVIFIRKAGYDDSSFPSSSTELLQYFIEKQVTCLRYNPRKKFPVFSESVSTRYSKSSTVVESESNTISYFVQQMKKVLEDASVGVVDVASINELSNFQLGENIVLNDAMNIISWWISVMDNHSIWPWDTVSTFLAMLENFFQSLPEETMCPVMKLFYEEYLLKHENSHFLIYLKTFSSDITKYIGEIGDHNEIRNNPEKFKKARKKLSWYLLIVPGPTICRLLLQCLENKSIVPGIFRFCGILFQLTFKSEKVTQEYVPILIDSIIRIFEEEVDRLTNTERQNNFVYLLCSLCRRKRGPLAGKFGIALTVEKPILAGNVLLRLFILPNIMKRIHELVMLKLFHRLIQQMGVKDTYFEWETAFHGDRMDAAQTPELLLLITKLLIEYEYKNKEIATVCQSLLKSLGEKLRYDDVVFDMKTVEFILFSLQCRPWWVRYAICTWFSHTLSAPVQQIPSGLYKSLSLDHQEHFEEISVDMPFSHVQCFFRSLFELALFDVDLSLDILHKGIAVLPRDENLIEKIAISLVDSCEQSSYRQNITSLVSLLSELLKRFDPSQEVRFVEPVCESTYHGLRLIRNILLIATSVKFAYHKINLGSSTSGSSQSYIFGSHSNSVADDLLQAFCQLTKIHVDKEVVNFRRSILPHPPDIKEIQLPPPDITIRRDERVYVQLTTLFNATCSFTRLVPQPTSSLLVLINCLAEYIVEFQNLNVTKCLDDFSPDHYKANTVYAIAQTDVTNQLKDNQKECGQKSKPGCNTAVPCRTKVDTMHTFATARQINALNIRRLAENRLLKRGISPNKSILISDFSDVPGQNRRKRRIAKHQ